MHQLSLAIFQTYRNFVTAVRMRVPTSFPCKEGKMLHSCTVSVEMSISLRWHCDKLCKIDLHPPQYAHSHDMWSVSHVSCC